MFGYGAASKYALIGRLDAAPGSTPHPYGQYFTVGSHFGPRRYLYGPRGAPPYHPPPAHALCLAVNTDDWTKGTGQFNVTVRHWPALPPQLDSLDTNSGSTLGADPVTITGAGFTDTVAVMFGGNPAQFSVNSDSQITALTPAAPAGTAEVVVRSLIGPSNPASFTYQIIVGVSQLQPSSGPAAGGTHVTITGTGFTEAAAVAFGSTTVWDFSIASDTEITITSPPGIGTVDVTVFANGTWSAPRPGGRFIYISALITAVDPRSGPASGGTPLTITGSGFTGVTQVYFEQQTARSFQVINDTQIRAVSPPSTGLGPGTVDILLYTESSGTTTDPTPADQYTYLGAEGNPLITAVDPAAARRRGNAPHHHRLRLHRGHPGLLRTANRPKLPSDQ